MSAASNNVQEGQAKPPSAYGRYSDIPGEDGWPIIGHTLEMLRNPRALSERMKRAYGDIYRTRLFGRTTVNMCGPDCNEFVLMDREQNFSSEKGWNAYLGRLFPRGLMLMDFDHHRAHRKIMATAFKTEPMRRYMEKLGDEIPARLRAWGDKGDILFYDEIKQLSLDLATSVFLGLEPGDDSKKVNQALTDMVQASVGVMRLPLPFTKMRKGVRGRAFMQHFLRGLIAERRRSDGEDIFTLLCQAEDDDGNSFTDDDIIDHMNFLWMAAHDTITSSVTTLAYGLAKHPDWQQKCRQEVADLHLNDGRLPYEKMNELVMTEYCFKEALRLCPPVPGIARETVRDVTFKGITIPKGTAIGLSPSETHKREDIWPDPDSFNPMRFSAEGGAKERHRFAWIPFSGGAHMCLGLHFAYMQAKVIMAHLLPRWQIEVPSGYEADYQVLPLMRPVDRLPVHLRPLDAGAR